MLISSYFSVDLARRQLCRRAYSAISGHSWIGERLSFKCTACGRCCQGADQTVSVNPHEAEQIATSLGLDDVQFRKEYIQDSLQQSGQLLLRKNATGTACIFLGTDGRTCKIYENRPIQCRTYPWWPELLTSSHDWAAEALRCEGIRLAPAPLQPHNLHNPKQPTPSHKAAASTSQTVNDEARQPAAPNAHQPGEASDAAPGAEHGPASAAAPLQPQQFADDSQVAVSVICKNLVLEEIRRSGEMGVFSYEELEDLLENVSPELVDDFAADFWEHNKREVLFESQQGLKVLQSTIGVPPQQSRSLIFSGAPGYVQTEVGLQNSPDGLVPDHSSLMLPPHRGLCYAICIHKLNQQRPLGAQLAADLGIPCPAPAQPSIRTLILGAGGCALPMSLRQHYPSMTLEAVELDPEVLQLAQQYFGACEDGRLKLQAADAVPYTISLPADVKYDIVLVDAALLDNASPGEVVAPPPEFLQPRFVQQGMCAHLREGGVVAVNAVGGMSAVLRVFQRLSPYFGQLHACRTPEQSIVFAAGPMPTSRGTAAASNEATTAALDLSSHISVGELAAAASRDPALRGLCQDLLYSPLTQRWQVTEDTLQELKSQHQCGWYSAAELRELLPAYAV